MIQPDQFPNLVEFMRQCLFQHAATTFEEAIHTWKLNGEESVLAVVREINELLSGDHSPNEINRFFDQHSDYEEVGGGRATLEHIRSVLHQQQ